MSLSHSNLWPGVAFHLTVSSHNPWSASSSTASQLAQGVSSFSSLSLFSSYLPSPLLLLFSLFLSSPLLILWITILCHVIETVESYSTRVIIDSWRKLSECRGFRKKNIYFTNFISWIIIFHWYSTWQWYIMLYIIYIYIYMYYDIYSIYIYCSYELLQMNISD